MIDRLESLRDKYIGKSYYFLTVIDVVLVDGCYKLKCQCKCGNAHIISHKKFGVTKSCGCYQKSKEYRQTCHEWNISHRDILEEKGRRYSQWCKDNPEKFASRNGNIRKSWTHSRRESFGDVCRQKYADNPDMKSDISNRVSNWWSQLSRDDVSQIKQKHRDAKVKSRLLDISKDLIDSTHEDDVQKIFSGEIISSCLIRTKCPECGCYDAHTFSNVYHISSKTYIPRLCSKCYSSYSSSSYESEIADYISTFYIGECIRNSRDIISPLEVDLYYPEKKIAIEFNGDYWHDEIHKPADYHYSKFKRCYDSGIILVSIFESAWLSNKSINIRQYLYDLFNGVANDISYNEDKTLMNNNFPFPYIVTITDTVEDSYTSNKNVVHTCGFSKFI